MYRIFCDEWQLHNMTMPSLKLVNPKADLEVNKAGSFTFTIYPQHPYYDKLQKMKSIILIYQNDRIIFRGRILNSKKGFYNQKQVTCEGELAFFVDSVIRPYYFQGDVPEYFSFLIGEHNKQVEASKQFKVGNVTVTDPNGYITRSDSTYPTTYDCITKKLVDSLGGYIQFRHEEDGVYIDYLSDFTTLNSQDIEIKKNIIDINDEEKCEEIATAIIPLGAKIENEESDVEASEDTDTEDQNRITIESVNGGKDYVYNQEAVEKYGWIFKTVTWDDVTLPENLLRKANEKLAESILFENTVEVNAVDLSGTNTEISSFSVGSYNNVKSKQHGIERKMLVKKLSLNLNAPQNDTMTLGDTRKTFTEQNKENSDKLGDVVEHVEKVIGDYQVNMPIIEEVVKKLTLELSRNHPMIQSYSPENGTYTPDYTNDPLIITPTAKYRAKVVQPSYIWKRLVDGSEVDLEGFEVIDDSTGVMTINQNMTGKYSVYICYATYRSGSTTLVANATIDLNRVDDGTNGIPGTNGKTSYFHVKYSSVPDPQNADQMSEIPNIYIGTYVDYTEADSTNPGDYTWSKFQGADGQDGSDGIPGKNGADGKTSYLHIAYANSANGQTDFSVSDSTGRAYMGQYVDFTQADSNNPADYTWSLIKGEDGEDAAIASDTEPTDKTKMWLDTSMDPPQLKAWNGKEWIFVNDPNNQIQAIREELISSIEQEATDIRAEVSENYYLKDDAETLIQSVGTQLEQTKEEFNFTFNEFQQSLEDLENGTNAEFQNIQKYIRFVDGKILLGIAGNELELQLANDRISFFQNGAEVAYFTNNRFYVKDGEFTNSLTLGNFAFIPRSNGNLSFKKVR